jgi:hypothetical protein
MAQNLDGDYGIDYQLRIIEHMITELPPTIEHYFREQIVAIRKAIDHKDSLLASLMRTSLSDVRLDVVSLQHDLEATRRERDLLRQRLRDNGLDDKLK